MQQLTHLQPGTNSAQPIATMATSEHEAQLFQLLISTIASTVPCDKIYLLNRYPALPPAVGIEYDMLILVTDEANHCGYVYESQLTNKCRPLTPISTTILRTSFVQQMLLKGAPFFSIACLPHKLVYDAGYLPLIISTDIAAAISQQVQEAFYLRMGNAKTFYELAVLCKNTGNIELACYMLHHTAEEAMNALLDAMLGFRHKTHNLRRLLQRTRRLTAIGNLFPCNTNDEIQLFYCLQNAYLQARYNYDYAVTPAQLSVLIERVNRLQVVVQNAFATHPNNLPK
jgi:HEPN domain-containing protein